MGTSSLLIIEQDSYWCQTSKRRLNSAIYLPGSLLWRYIMHGLQLPVLLSICHLSLYICSLSLSLRLLSSITMFLLVQNLWMGCFVFWKWNSKYSILCSVQRIQWEFYSFMNHMFKRIWRKKKRERKQTTTNPNLPNISIVNRLIFLDNTN